MGLSPWGWWEEITLKVKELWLLCAALQAPGLMGPWPQQTQPVCVWTYLTQPLHCTELNWNVNLNAFFFFFLLRLLWRIGLEQTHFMDSPPICSLSPSFLLRLYFRQSLKHVDFITISGKWVFKLLGSAKWPEWKNSLDILSINFLHMRLLKGTLQYVGSYIWVWGELIPLLYLKAKFEAIYLSLA